MIQVLKRGTWGVRYKYARTYLSNSTGDRPLRRERVERFVFRVLLEPPLSGGRPHRGGESESCLFGTLAT